MKSLALAIIFFITQTCGADTKQGIEFFETRVRPILVEYCVKCHGPKKQKSGLRVDHISFLLKPAEFGKPIVPRKPDKSVLMHAIEHRDPDLKMPGKGKRLSDLAIRDFRRWIQMGAPWPNEPVPVGIVTTVKTFDLEARKKRLPWIWQTPQKQAPPRVKEQSWVTYDVDRFVLAKLEEKKLAHAPPAEAQVWLRRVYFAIIGLPPTPDAIAKFVADPSPKAREKVVDELLASPQFGERWARHWMDLVRYAESRGHESDFVIANAWRYRDYLIRAFNDDVPYDRFVTEHLAGDIMKSPRIDRKSGVNQSVLGTGWVFLGEEIHTPVDIRLDETERLDNKVDVLSKTFLGLTVACARCHDHKFDAILQSDYYALAGYVLSSNYRQVRFETMEHNRHIASQLDTLTKRTRKQMSFVLADALRNALKSKWDGIFKRMLEDKSHTLHSIAKTIGDPRAARQLRESWRATNKKADEALRGYQVLVDYSDPNALWLQDGYTFGPRPRRPGDLLIGDDNRPVHGIAVNAAAVKDSFWDSLALAAGNTKDPGKLDSSSRSGRMVRTSKITLQTGKLFYLMSGEANVYAGVDSNLLITGPLHTHQIRHVKGNLGWHSHDVSESNGGRVHVQFGAVPGKPLAIHKVVEGNRAPPLIQRPNAALLELLKNEVTGDKLRATIIAVLDRFRAGKALDASQAELINVFIQQRELIGEPAWATLQKQATVFRDRRAELRKKIRTHSATAVAWMNGNGVDENVMIRGKYTRPGKSAPRRLPTAFGITPVETRDSGRLQLAQQIVNVKNPLTARVYVNRVWHHLFGRGIVETVDNFGYLGKRPTHPLLLDHLSWQFVHQDDWSTKKLIRRLVLSKTFSMSSRPVDTNAERADPKNIWLHRMPIRRLEAEAIRDAVLTISGQLNPRDHDKPMPPVPVHLTEFVVGRGRPAKSGPLNGGGRRSVYIATRRNFLPTMMRTFDMPTPFSTVGRRTVTNVPAQSLVLMNDPFLYQQARVWAERVLRKMPKASATKRIEQMYWQAFGRAPSANETKQCTAALVEFAVKHAVDTNHVEVWRDLCHALFSVNDFIYVR
jgi:hypothetical protein